MKRFLLTICIALLATLGASSAALAQTNLDIVPDGADQFFFSEKEQGNNTDNEKKLEALKKVEKVFNKILKGDTITKQITDPKDSKKKIDNPAFKACQDARKKVLTTMTGKAPKIDTSTICSKPGIIEMFQQLQKAYREKGCSLKKVGKGKDTKGQELAKIWATETAQIEKAVTSKEQVSSVCNSLPGGSAKKADATCTELYYAYQCLNRVSEHLLAKRRVVQQQIGQLENPEYYKCQFKEENGKLTNRNKVCVQLTERIGSTRVIGAETGLGLLKAYLALIYRYLVIIIGIFAVGVIIFNGVRITAGGSEQVEAAKTGLQNALIGLVVLLLASAILAIINPNFFTL